MEQFEKMSLEKELTDWCANLDSRDTFIKQEGDTIKVFVEAGSQPRLKEKRWHISYRIKENELLHNFQGAFTNEMTADVIDPKSSIKRIEVYFSKDN